MATLVNAPEIYDRLRCPICSEIPVKEIYQCNNGDIYCGTCERSIGSTCPTCKVLLEPRIRNTMIENVLDCLNLKVDCPFKKEGCSEKFYRKDMEVHLETCQFGDQVQPPTDVKWIAKKDGKVPKYGFIAGMDSGKPVYVIRASHNVDGGSNNGVIPGKLKLEDKYGYIEYGHAAIPKPSYEVLTCPEGMLKWVASSDGMDVQNAVVGGRDPAGEWMYIGRVSIRGNVSVGKVVLSEGLCYIPNSRKQAYRKYEILVRG